MVSLWEILVFGTVLFIAYVNGANDNFKGVATLFGSGIASYQKALVWATATTLLGSLCAYFWADKLVKTFSGKGLVPDMVIAEPAFLVAVILGAGLTVFTASRIGSPISTTHSLTGALVGAGFVAVGERLGFSALKKNFFIPLVISPLLALGLTFIFYFLFRWAGKVTGISRESCVCAGEKAQMSLAMAGGITFSTLTLPQMDVFVGEREVCQAKSAELHSGKIFGVSIREILDDTHFLSAGAVSFARGLNDTPKIVALSVAFGTLGLGFNITFVAVLMAFGGIIGARKVAETMSHKITSINPGQGLTANFVTAFLVILASCLGFPVSTTHVSCGSLFGIGLINKRANGKMIGSILLAWLITLPLAAVLSAGCYYLINAFHLFLIPKGSLLGVGFRLRHDRMTF